LSFAGFVDVISALNLYRAMTRAEQLLPVFRFLPLLVGSKESLAVG